MTLQQIKDTKLTVDIEAPTYESAQIICKFFEVPIASAWYNNRDYSVYTIDRGKLTSCRCKKRYSQERALYILWSDLTDVDDVARKMNKSNSTTVSFKKLNAPLIDSVILSAYVCGGCLKAIYLPQDEPPTNIKRCPYCERALKFEV